MKCPICKDVDLVMSERQSIEIDYCPECRGVWLDRGELDKIIERSDASPPPERREAGPRPDEHRGGHDDHRGGYGGKRKRKSFLHELFD